MRISDWSSDVCSSDLPGTEESIMTLLSITDLSAGYGEVSVLHGVTLNVPAGKVIALVGANGAGKSTLLRTISGQIRATSGTIEYRGQAINNLQPDKIVAAGLVQVPEGRRLFPSKIGRAHV